MSTTIVLSEGKAGPPAVSSIHDIPLEKIRESASNPRRAFDENQLREFADFVPGNKISIMLRSAFCGRSLKLPCSSAEGRALRGT